MSGPILEAYRRVGFVELGGRPGAEIALRAVGRFWSLSGNEPLRPRPTRPASGWRRACSAYRASSHRKEGPNRHAAR